ncbi:DMT family transporter [Leucobacter sp. USHLN153]|uniref:DMT family transporter n=1 Tax=Leucobacter sp. USHLN153 TaxID=3081268 RepID=UPI003016C982
MAPLIRRPSEPSESSTDIPGPGTESARRPEAKVARPIHWLVLLASAMLEAVWALALDAADGFTVLGPTVIFAIASTLSMLGLAFAMRGLPVSTAYAVWTGLGAALTVGVSMLMGTEPPSLVKLLFLAGIIGCVIGLKFVKDPGESPGRSGLRFRRHPHRGRGGSAQTQERG